MQVRLLSPGKLCSSELQLLILANSTARRVQGAEWPSVSFLTGH